VQPKLFKSLTARGLSSLFKRAQLELPVAPIVGANQPILTFWPKMSYSPAGKDAASFSLLTLAASADAAKINEGLWTNRTIRYFAKRLLASAMEEKTA
jgi:hypothetical protein